MNTVGFVYNYMYELNNNSKDIQLISFCNEQYYIL